jgi:hypothetical protein
MQHQLATATFTLKASITGCFTKCNMIAHLLASAKNQVLYSDRSINNPDSLVEAEIRLRKENRA